MRRIRIERPGGYDRLTMETVADPEPGPGEVLIRVAAVGVNFADCIARMGLYKSAREFEGWPLTPGFEVAGEVMAVGEGVSTVKVGERVMALSLFNAYADRVCVPEHQLRSIPEHWSLAEAAAFPTVFLTAWYALHALGDIQPGHRVLIHSAAGGVGQALVQLARRAAAHVVGVVGRSHKVDSLKAHGIDVIDKSRQALWSEAGRLAPDGFDLIADANGYPTLKQSYRHLAPGGRLLVYGFHGMFHPDRRGRGRVNWPAMIASWFRTPRFSPLAMTSENRAVMGFNLSFMGHRPDVLRTGFDQLLQWAAEGDIHPLPVTTYAFDDVASAHRDLESGQTTGKLVLLT
ncbi:synaptic vesicle VAT-1 family membrane protein [Natronospira bacteriovora]|uniref:Medium chain dehydrogenase/reductase family protein n=1 Tax=Natronospira bacteriovora TaxID=3069753 RepID=A0ABU0W7L5_9GAMM|nr:medium chain dehydrogenase/reductase family protein [Natronospira sp. AB-CW4]MDQ2070025.1 medium chain dehydrogenase/reductase family protein [Natronospira sp. AB-CW4]